MTLPISELVQRLREDYEFRVSIVSLSYRETVSRMPLEAADALTAQADRIAALDAKCRLYEAALDKADVEMDRLKRDAARLDFVIAQDVSWYPGRAANGYGIMCHGFGVARKEVAGKTTLREAIDAALSQSTERDQ